MKRLLLLLCLSAAVRPAAAQTAVSGFVRSLPERLARPLDDTLVVLRDLELLAPRRVMQSFDVVSDSTIYISQLGAFENHVPGRTRSHEVYVFEVRPGCDTMPRMTLRYFGHGANIAVEECGGTRYVWIDSNATRVGGEYWQSCTVSRIPFRAGTCCDHDGGETFYFDDGCFNLLPAVDRAHDLLSISYRKAEYITDFARKVQSGECRIEEIWQMPDEEVIRVLSSLKGIGVWTAEMILLFCMQRPDVLSYDDLAIQRGLRMLYHHRKIDRRRYSPYGSVASLYLWAIAGGAIPGMRDYAPAKPGSKKPKTV